MVIRLVVVRFGFALVWSRRDMQLKGGWVQAYFHAVDGIQGREKGVVII